MVGEVKNEIDNEKEKGTDKRRDFVTR